MILMMMAMMMTTTTMMMEINEPPKIKIQGEFHFVKY